MSGLKNKNHDQMKAKTLEEILDLLRQDKMKVEDRGDVWEFYDNKFYGTTISVMKQMFPQKIKARLEAENVILEVIKRRDGRKD